jgi:NAD(P)-dependent dehydrogenase (short-subunit alcohol dehydrogenase family)
MSMNVAVIGSSGALGSAFVRRLAASDPNASIHAFSRQQAQVSIQTAAAIASEQAALDLVIVATGILQEGETKPEKSLSELSSEKFHQLFEINAVLPALVAKHFIPQLNKDSRSLFAALSARVGSISDNQLGGWYAYRASKAALNMIIKTSAIETRRRNKQAIIVGLHPGTVDSNLTKPFQHNIPEGELFTADFSVEKLLQVLENLKQEQSGLFFAWDGEEIQP